MMRYKVLMESRYRGKRILDNKWVYGTYMKEGNNHFIISKINKNGYAKCIAVSKDTVSKFVIGMNNEAWFEGDICLLYTSPSPRDRTRSRMPSSA